MVTLIILCMYVSVIRICLLQDELAVEGDQNILFCTIKVLFWGVSFFFFHFGHFHGLGGSGSAVLWGGGVLSQYNDM